MLRVGFWWSAAARERCACVWACLRRGAAVSGSARRQTARGGAGALPASGWRVCTGCPDARAVAPAFGTLAPGGGGLGAAGAGLNAPWEGFARRRTAITSELPYPGRRAPRRLQAIHAASARCGARLGAPAARRGGFWVGAASELSRASILQLMHLLSLYPPVRHAGRLPLWRAPTMATGVKKLAEVRCQRLWLDASVATRH